MTRAQIQSLIDAAKTANPDDRVTWAELKEILEALKNSQFMLEDDILSDISDVSDATPSNGQVLTYNNGTWSGA